MNGCLGYVAGGLDSQNRNAFSDKVLEQVTVVAGDLHDPALIIQSETLRNRIRVPSSVLEPAIGIGRKISIVREDILGHGYGLQLDQKALGADIRMERIEWLHLLQLLGFNIRVGQRRHPKIHESMAQRRPATPATSGLGGGHKVQAAVG